MNGSPRLLKWILSLQPYQLHFVHVPSEKNYSDSLSRYTTQILDFSKYQKNLCKISWNPTIEKGNSEDNVISAVTATARVSSSRANDPPVNNSQVYWGMDTADGDYPYIDLPIVNDAIRKCPVFSKIVVALNKKELPKKLKKYRLRKGSLWYDPAVCSSVLSCSTDGFFPYRQGSCDLDGPESRQDSQGSGGLANEVETLSTRSHSVVKGGAAESAWDDDKFREGSLLVIPPSLERIVFRLGHEPGHHSFAFTLNRLRKLYHFQDGFVGRLMTFVNSSLVCQRCSESRTIIPPMGEGFSPKYPWLIAACDVIGPLTESDGNRYILVCVCLFTRFVVAVPLRDTSSQTIAQALVDSLYSKHGAVEMLILDNASYYRSEVFRSVLNILGISPRYTPAYCPSANRTERANRDIKRMLSKLVRAKQDRWSSSLQLTIMNLNSQQNPSGFSANFLVYGRELRQQFETVTHPPPRTYHEFENYIVYLRETLFDAYQLADEHNTEIRMKLRQKYNQSKVFDRDIVEGDVVFMRNHKFRKTEGSLGDHWTGPVVARQVLKGNRFEISDMANRKT